MYRYVGTGHRPAPAGVVELQNHELNKQLMMLNQFDDDEKTLW